MGVSGLPRRAFFKMTGSGNDFVIFDARLEPAGSLSKPGAIQAICARGTGVGADGVVFLERSPGVAFRMAYFNSDGSRASLCGNAALCCTRLAVRLGVATASGFAFETDAGPIAARMAEDLPEIDLAAISALRAEAGIELAEEQGERRIGYAVAGVPHLVVFVDDLDRVQLETRGSALRRDRSLASSGGANVNFVARGPDAGWRVRTYERGVEGETLACGTGAVATAALLNAWQESGDTTELVTRSGSALRVTLRNVGGELRPSLRGEGRLVFEGTIGEL